MELAKDTLGRLGTLAYEATAIAGDGREVKIPVRVTEQIEDLLGLHLATPVRES